MPFYEEEVNELLEMVEYKHIEKCERCQEDAPCEKMWILEMVEAKQDAEALLQIAIYEGIEVPQNTIDIIEIPF